MDSHALIPVVMAGLAAMLSYLATPSVIRIATVAGALDPPGGRKIHSVPIPRLGGVAVAAAVAITLAGGMQFFPEHFGPGGGETLQWSAILAGACLLVLLGAWDDVRPIGAGIKFAVQGLAALAAYVGGVRFGGPLLQSWALFPGDPGALPAVVTLLWIVGVTNALNLIDGLDGLASGVTIIASLAFAVAASGSSDTTTALVAVTLAGAAFGFLRFNGNPARIFLGDSGSLPMGYLLAVLSVRATAGADGAIPIIVPLLALGLPVTDTMLSMVRRFLRAIRREGAEGSSILHRLRAMVVPDREHIHHRLLDGGATHRDAVLLLYVVQAAFGVCACLVSMGEVDPVILLLLVGILTAAGISRLGYREVAFLRGGVFLPLFNTPLLQRKMFQVALDLAFVMTAILGSQGLLSMTIPGGVNHPHTALGAACILQLTLLLAGGIARRTFRLAGTGDVLDILRTVVVAVLGSAVLTDALMPELSTTHQLAFWILDFYLLASFVVGSRFSFAVLEYLARRWRSGRRRVLIYGANPTGQLLLENILHGRTREIEAVGFVDEDPIMEGKVINGYPVFGGHWKLESVLRTRRIDEICLAAPGLHPEVFRRVRTVAVERGVLLREGVEAGSKRRRTVSPAPSLSSGMRA